MSRRGGGRGKVSHKGRRRHFTDAEDLKHDLEKAKREQEWREARGELPSDEEVVKVGSDDSSSSSEEEDDKSKAKGVSSLIDVENPNHAQQKMKKVTTIDVNAGGATAQLSRREREEIAKQQDKIRYDKLHAEGKTDQAKADLARLAIIKKQREEVAKKRNEEKKAKEMVAAAKASKK